MPRLYEQNLLQPDEPQTHLSTAPLLHNLGTGVAPDFPILGLRITSGILAAQENIYRNSMSQGFNVKLNGWGEICFDFFETTHLNKPPKRFFGILNYQYFIGFGLSLLKIIASEMSLLIYVHVKIYPQY